jgi:hypothetical protein
VTNAPKVASQHVAAFEKLMASILEIISFDSLGYKLGS